MRVSDYSMQSSFKILVQIQWNLYFFTLIYDVMFINIKYNNNI
jgi:hypothetical protein